MDASCRDVALRLLARREHSCFELLQKLRLRGYGDAEIHTTLDALQEKGWQSDLRYAECYVGHRSKLGYGPIHIQRSLLKKGLAFDLIEKVLGCEEWQWFNIALAVYQKQIRLKKTAAEAVKFLQNRGFTQDIIKSLFAQIS